MGALFIAQVADTALSTNINWKEFNETWQEARYQCPVPSLCLSDRSEKQDCRPRLWLTFLASVTAEQNSTKLDRKQDLNALYQVCVYGAIGEKRWPLWPPICWDIFSFSYETTERNSTKLDRKQDLNVLYLVCVCQFDRKNKMAAQASDWHSTSSLKPLNRIQRNLTESKISSSSTKFVIFEPVRKQDGRPGLWLTETRRKISISSTKFVFREKQDGRFGFWLSEAFWTSPLKPPKGIQTKIKISTSSTEFVSLMPMNIPKMTALVYLSKRGTLYSGARYETLCASCFSYYIYLFTTITLDECHVWFDLNWLRRALRIVKQALDDKWYFSTGNRTSDPSLSKLAL